MLVGSCSGRLDLPSRKDRTIAFFGVRPGTPCANQATEPPATTRHSAGTQSKPWDLPHSSGLHRALDSTHRL